MFQPLEEIKGGPEDKNSLVGMPPGTFYVYPWETNQGTETEYRFEVRLTLLLNVCHVS